MKIYISGKIGEVVISEATRAKFAKAEEKLKDRGFEVFNPCDEKWQTVLKEGYENQFFDCKKTIPATSVSFYTYALLRDQMVMATKDAVYFLEDWINSKGAKSEHQFAAAIGLEIIYEFEEHIKYFDENE